jgi:hypothetical protein
MQPQTVQWFLKSLCGRVSVDNVAVTGGTTWDLSMLGPIGADDIRAHWTRMRRDHPTHPALAKTREADLDKTIPLGFHGDDVADLKDACLRTCLHTFVMCCAQGSVARGGVPVAHTWL